MTIYEKISIGGTTINEVLTLTINKSTGENNSSSSFEANVDNLNGIHNDDFVIGNEIIIYADIDINPPTTVIFKGILESVDFTGSPNDEKVRLTGRDYSARLMDRYVEPEVYTDDEVSVIVKDIVSKYADDITTTNVDVTTTTLNRMVFMQTNVFDAIKKLADLVSYNFYVDENKDLHFEPKSTISSGYTFDNTNVLTASFNEDRSTLFNKIWVYGDRYLDGYKQTFTAGSPLGGSIFTLLYNPHSTQVTVNSVLIQPGGIFNMLSTAGSGVKYGVNYEDKQIIFTSGTNYGNNIPASGVSVIIDYQRSLPVVKVGDNETSKAQYGTRVKVIVDKDIKDPDIAQDRLTQELNDNAYPKMEGNISIKGVLNVTPTQTCIVNLPYHGINNKQYEIIEASYDFNKENNLAETVLSLKVNKKLGDITDTIKNIINDLKKIQAGDISESDIITRYQYTTGSIGIRQSGLTVYTKNIAGDTLIWGNANFGIWGTGKWGDSATVSFILGNLQGGILGTSLLGTRSSEWTTNWSGGYLT